MVDDDGSVSAPEYTRREIYHEPIVNLVAALGGMEVDEGPDGQPLEVYKLGDECLGCLKDLKKFWRKDDTDESRTVARILYETNVLHNDLIPILKITAGRGEVGDRIALAAADLMGSFTWPISLSEELQELAEAEEKPDTLPELTTLIQAQYEYKQAILHAGAIDTLFTHLLLPRLYKTRMERSERDNQVIILIMHIFRNLAAVKEPVDRPGLQSDLIIQFEAYNVFDTLATIASSSDKVEFNHLNVLALEIFHLLYRGVVPEDLLKEPGKAPSDNLSKLLAMEENQKRAEARKGVSRHSRFGTTISVVAGQDRYVITKQRGISASTDKTMDLIKKKKWTKPKNQDETVSVVLSPPAITALRELANVFLSSCFNTFFATLLKDIRMERAKVRESDKARFLHLCGFFLRYFLACVKWDREHGVDRKSDAGRDFDLIAEMVETGSVGFVTARMKITIDDKPPSWKELHAGIDCFTQILLVVDAMAVTGEEEYVEAAEILQDQIYYNGDVLDLVVQVVSKYKEQSIKYLDSVIHLAYVILRMLEKYSKTKAFMFIRKRRAKRNKRKNDQSDKATQDVENLIPDAEDEDDAGADREAPSFAEHKFTFASFEGRFANENVVQTCLQYLQRHQEFEEPEQLKRVVGLLHRAAVKAQAEGLFFKVSTLNVFRTVQEQTALQPKTGSYKDLDQLITFVLRKFFKAAAENPLLFIEVFYPKSHGKWKEYSSFVPDEKPRAGGRSAEPKAKHLPAEVEVVPGFTITQQLGIAMAALQEEGREELIHWAREILALVAAQRQEIILSTDGPPEEAEVNPYDVEPTVAKGPSEAALAKFEDYAIPCDTKEKKDGTIRNPHLKLMFRILDFKASESDIVWTVPSSLLPSALESSINIIDGFLREPLDMDGEKASDRLRKKRRPPRRRKHVARPTVGSDSELVDSEEEAPRRRKKKQKEQQNYLSAQFIEDSDEDEEALAAFFAREEEIRKQAFARAASAATSRENMGGKKKRKRGKAAAAEPSSSISAGDGDEDGDGDAAPREGSSSPRRRGSSSTPRDGDGGSDDDAQSSRRSETPRADSPERSRPRPKPRPRASPAAKAAMLSDEKIHGLEPEPEPDAMQVDATSGTAEREEDEEEGAALAPTTGTQAKRRRVIESDDEN